MRTTNEVIEAARLGEPCTEEELRLTIVSMRRTAILTHMSHARWSADVSLPMFVRALAKRFWKSINEDWNIPLDKRVGLDDRPSNPELIRRKKVAEKVWDRSKGEKWK